MAQKQSWNKLGGLLDFGTHGRQAIRHEGPAGSHKRKVREYFTGKGKPDDFEFSPEQSREATNYLKAVDRSNSGDDWSKDLGGGQNFMQGPSSYNETFKHKDSILGMLPDSEALDDLATDKASEETAWKRMIAGENETELDRNEMDSEALDEFQMDLASDRTARIDNIDPSGPAIYKQKYADSETLSDLREDELSELNADLGPDKMELAGKSIDESVPVPFGGLRDAFSGAGDYVSGLFSSDGKEDVEGKKAFGKALLGKATGAPEPGGGGQTRIAEARTTGGKVAFPGLLNKPQRQRSPYFMPKGLV